MKVSIIITAYNFEKFILAAVSSILSQRTKFELEVILIDDCSQDNTKEVILNLSDNRLIKVFNPANLGSNKSVQLGFSLATGDFICRFDGDDKWHPDFVERSIGILLEHPEIDMVYSDVYFIDTNDVLSGVETNNIARPEFDNPIFNDEYISILKRYYICAPGIMARREAWARALPIPSELSAIDWYMSCKILQFGRAYFINEKLAYYRIHKNNMHVWSVINKHESLVTETILKYFVRNAASFNFYEKSEIIAANYILLASKYYSAHMFLTSLKWWFMALVYPSTYLLTYEYWLMPFKNICRLLLFPFNKFKSN